MSALGPEVRHLWAEVGVVDSSQFIPGQMALGDHLRTEEYGCSVC